MSSNTIERPVNNNNSNVIYLVLARTLSTAMHFIYIFNDYSHQGLVPCVQKAVAPELREAGGRERCPPLISLTSILVLMEFKSKFFNYFSHQIKLKYIYVL
jgi:hypothetical protein